MGLFDGRIQAFLGEKGYNSSICCGTSLESAEKGLFGELLCETKIESFGVCAEPSKLQKGFQNFASKQRSLRLLYLRFTGKVVRTPKFSKEDELYADSPPAEFSRAYGEAVRNGTTPPQRSPSPSEAEFRARWKQIQGRVGVTMRKRSWNLSPIGPLVPTDFPICRFSPV